MRRGSTQGRHGRIRSLEISKLKEKESTSDDKSHTGGQDRKRISLNEDYEVRDWAEKFGVTEQQLRTAVKKVGDSADAVEAELKR